MVTSLSRVIRLFSALVSAKRLCHEGSVNWDLVLASGSPRRRALLKALGLCLNIESPDVDESPRQGESAEAYVSRVAQLKAERVLAARQATSLLLAADTAVALGGALLGKPESNAEAKRMLKRLSGNWHRVHTGVVVWSPSVGFRRDVVTTEVRFRRLLDAEIDRYVALHRPLDKAGAYGIQDEGAALVAEIQGSYTNVVGLPVEESLALLIAAGLERER